MENNRSENRAGLFVSWFTHGILKYAHTTVTTASPVAKSIIDMQKVLTVQI